MCVAQKTGPTLAFRFGRVRAAKGLEGSGYIFFSEHTLVAASHVPPALLTVGFGLRHRHVASEGGKGECESQSQCEC